jgi:phosphohistidine phosphatase
MMKKLFLIRHAKSSWDNLALSDFDRPLNSRGEKDAPRMARALKERNVHPDLMLTSPAVRALTTCLVMAEVLGYPNQKIVAESQLYHASEESLLKIIQHIPDRKDDEEVVLLFGHNPGLTEFANLLLGENINNIPTCGVVASTLAAKTWKEVNWGCGKLDFFDFPKKK